MTKKTKAVKPDTKERMALALEKIAKQLEIIGDSIISDGSFETISDVDND